MAPQFAENSFRDPAISQRLKPRLILWSLYGIAEATPWYESWVFQQTVWPFVSGHSRRRRSFTRL